jgi:hypothetical protein
VLTNPDEDASPEAFRKFIDASAGVEIVCDTRRGRALARLLPVGAEGWVPEHDHLAAVGAPTLQDRDPALRGHLDHGTKLVQQQCPRRAGLPGGVVQVRQREHRERRGLVGHPVGVRPPHHHS